MVTGGMTKRNQLYCRKNECNIGDIGGDWSSLILGEDGGYCGIPFIGG